MVKTTHIQSSLWTSWFLCLRVLFESRVFSSHAEVNGKGTKVEKYFRENGTCPKEEKILELLISGILDSNVQVGDLHTIIQGVCTGNDKYLGQ